MVRSKFLLLGCALAWSCSIRLMAQSSTADSLRAAVRQADSTANGTAALEGRLLLAPLAGSREAGTLLVEAAHLADSLDRPDLGATAHRLWAAQLARSGRAAAAYAELLRADSLERFHALRELTRLEYEDLAAQGLLAQERDSLAAAAQDEQPRMAKAIYDLQQRADMWMYTAIAAMALGLLLVIGLLYRAGQLGQKYRAAVEELKQERATTKKPGTGNVRTAPVAEVPATAEAPAAPVRDELATANDQAMKPVAAGMFLKDAPERLITLQDARKRGDHEKVLRVLATLRPQLLSHDAERFAPLIARLREVSAPGNTPQWNADLDLLESAIRELWSHHAGQ